mgnify:CR=1 FL=1
MRPRALLPAPSEVEAERDARGRGAHDPLLVAAREREQKIQAKKDALETRAREAAEKAAAAAAKAKAAAEKAAAAEAKTKKGKA